jgi:hypothetical protein
VHYSQPDNLPRTHVWPSASHAQANLAPATLGLDPCLLANLAESCTRPFRLSSLLAQLTSELVVLLEQRRERGIVPGPQSVQLAVKEQR